MGTWACWQPRLRTVAPATLDGECNPRAAHKDCWNPRASPTTAFVREEFDAVDVAKDSGRSGRPQYFGEGKCFYLFGAAFAVEPREFRNLPAIDLRGSESKFFLERLFQDMQISVFAKDQGKNKPIIPGADLAIRPLVSKKRFGLPGETSGGVQRAIPSFL